MTTIACWASGSIRPSTARSVWAASVPDVHGEPVHITAEQHGWYVFVYSFAGDDRVMPVTSAYNDGWERTRVNEYDTPERPAITTQVDPGKPSTSANPFHDTARITGDIPEGSFVVFDAYEAHTGGAGARRQRQAGERASRAGGPHPARTGGLQSRGPFG